ncbi:hypothetical protein F4679DRAFT_228904 [Xylaria curta]|nr:hypothetical protein F4679DRAFT_228904 [Xylaria curta]
MTCLDKLLFFVLAVSISLLDHPRRIRLISREYRLSKKISDVRKMLVSRDSSTSQRYRLDIACRTGRPRET